MSTIFRRIEESDYEALRSVRLEALRLHTENFSADPIVEEAFSREEWLARLASAFSFGAFVDGVLCGVVVFSQPRSSKIKHTGDVGAMYVRASARGQGIADKLLETAIDCAVGKVEQIKLTVNAENARAIKLYERHGFRTVGRMPATLRVDGRTYDELIMFRTVSTTD
jgi:ribosomal protein S18 acetylase RimI-like enzyme